MAGSRRVAVPIIGAWVAVHPRIPSWALVHYILLLVLPCSVHAGGLAPPNKEHPGFTSSGSMVIGKVAWEITETSTGKVLGDGAREIRESEVVVIPGKDEDYLEQRIPLSEGFYLKLNAGRDAEQFTGFGMGAGREDIATFCWEWFNVDGRNRALKLQEKGALEFEEMQIGSTWEITRTRFVTDVTMRVADWARQKSPRDPETWRVKILKDSDITWPTIVGKKVMSAEAAAQYLKTHPRPTPSTFWSNLVKVAAETSSTQR